MIGDKIAVCADMFAKEAKGWMRFSSQWITRRYCARSGTSSSSSRSTAMQNAIALK